MKRRGEHSCHGLEGVEKIDSHDSVHCECTQHSHRRQTTESESETDTAHEVGGLGVGTGPRSEMDRTVGSSVPLASGVWGPPTANARPPCASGGGRGEDRHAT